MVLSLLYKNSINFSPLLDNNKPQQDHIISKSELKNAQITERDINSIFNLRLVSASDNRTKSDEAFSAWRKRVGDTTIKAHFIPVPTEGKEWNAQNYDEFLNARKQIIMRELCVNYIDANTELDTSNQ